MLKEAVAIILIAVALSAQAVHAQWDSCRFDEVNCTGQCGAFTDTDSDGICDYSQPSPQDREAETQAESGIIALQGAPQGPLPGQLEPAQQQKAYHFIEITAALSALYAATYMISRKKKITLVAHRKLWNAFLLGAFIAMGVLSILLVVRIDYGWAPLPHFFMLYWHVETGIAMTVISIFHVLWHWRYYACIFRRSGGKTCES